MLIPTEIAEIKIATDAYNVTIAAAAEAKGLAFVDTRAVMTNCQVEELDSEISQ